MHDLCINANSGCDVLHVYVLNSMKEIEGV